MSFWAIPSLLVVWPLAGYTIYIASKYRASHWLAVWVTLLALFSTMTWIAPPGSAAYYIAGFGEFLAFLAMLIEAWRLSRARRYPPAFLVRAILSDAEACHVQATGGVREAVEHVVAVLKERGERGLTINGPRGASLTWHMHRQAVGIQDSLLILTICIYQMLFINAAESQGHTVRAGDSIDLDAWAMAKIADFLCNDEVITPLFGAPMPYSQAEYRKAVVGAPSTLVVPAEQAKKARRLYER